MSDETDIKRDGPAPRPRDAATLILVRRAAAGAEVLMGQRSASHAFMPNKYVFPGGRVDLADTRLKIDRDMKPEALGKCAIGTSEARARALALAAIRETFEEAGLRIAHAAPTPPKTKSDIWTSFMAAGCLPALDALDFVFRAITPPYRHRRFDTRFFLADAEAIFGAREMEGSGELLKLHWVKLEEATKLDLPNITRFVLQEIGRREQMSGQPQSVPFTYFRHGKPVRDVL
jgi:8-oxo-dGTP pyrophosphatase MutT (NUDIX family)